MSYGTCEWVSEILVHFAEHANEGEYVSWEISIEMECTHPGDPGKLSGPPENCYPPEPMEFEWRKLQIFVGEIVLFETTDAGKAESFLGRRVFEALEEKARDWAMENHEFPEPDEDF